MEFAIVAFYLVLYFVAINKIQNAVFFYVLIIPVGDFTSIMFLNLFGLNDMFKIILLYHLIRNNYIRFAFRFKDSKLKPLLWFLIIFLSTTHLNTIRLDILLQDYLARDIGLLYYIKKVALFTLELLLLLVLVRLLLQQKDMRLIAYKSMISSMIILVLSVYFAQYLSMFGFNIRTDSLLLSEDLSRNAGFYGGGDVNSLSTLLNLGICMVLISSFFYKQQLKLFQICVIGFLAIGMFLTGSRMALVSLVIIIFYYLLFMQISRTKKHTFFSGNLFYIIVAIFALYFAFGSDDRFFLVFERIQNQGITDEVSESGHRYIRWLAYLDFSLKDIRRFMFGSNELFYVFGGRRFIDAHNFFIMTLYANGVVVLSIFLYSFYKLSKYIIKEGILRPYFLMTIIILISLMIISQNKFLYYYIIFLAILLYSNKDRSNYSSERDIISGIT